MATGVAGGPPPKRPGKGLDGMVAHLAQEAGVGTGVPIGEDQFLRLTGDLLYRGGEAHFNRVLGPVLEAVVEMCGANADGRIDAEEFQSWLTGLGVDPTEAKDVAYRVPPDGDGEASPADLLAALRAHHFGRLETEPLATAAG